MNKREVYAILTDLEEEFLKKVRRVEKKCKALNLEFSVEKIGEEVRRVGKIEYGRQVTKLTLFSLYSVHGTARIDDWEFIGVVEIDGKGGTGHTIVHSVSTTPVPTSYYSSTGECDHCKTNRRRKTLYIIRNVKTGEYKQVGKACLKLYTGGLSAEHVAAYMSGFSCLEEYEDSRGWERIHFITPYYDNNEVIKYAVQLANKGGFRGTSSGEIANAEFLKKLLMESDDLGYAVSKINSALERKHIDMEYSKEDFYSKVNANDIKEIITHYTRFGRMESEFTNNVRTILNRGWCSLEELGYMAYLPIGWMNANRTRRMWEEDKQSEWIGKEGERIKNEEIKSCELVFRTANDFGEVFFYKFILPSGNVLMWKTGNELSKREVNEVKRLDFTVKAHVFYKQNKQTEVTRCKLYA